MSTGAAVVAGCIIILAVLLGVTVNWLFLILLILILALVAR